MNDNWTWTRANAIFDARKLEGLSTPPKWESGYKKSHEALLIASELVPIPGTNHYYFEDGTANDGLQRVFDGSEGAYLPTYNIDEEEWLVIQMANGLYQCVTMDDIDLAVIRQLYPLPEGVYVAGRGNFSYMTPAALIELPYQNQAYLERRHSYTYAVKMLDIVSGELKVFPTIHEAAKKLNVQAENLVPYVDRKCEVPSTRIFRNRYKLAFGGEYFRWTKPEEVDRAKWSGSPLFGFSMAHNTFGVWQDLDAFCADRNVLENEAIMHMGDQEPIAVGRDEWILVERTDKNVAALTAWGLGYREDNLNRPGPFKRGVTEAEWNEKTGRTAVFGGPNQKVATTLSPWDAKPLPAFMEKAVQMQPKGGVQEKLFDKIMEVGFDLLEDAPDLVEALMGWLKDHFDQGNAAGKGVVSSVDQVLEKSDYAGYQYHLTMEALAEGSKVGWQPIGDLAKTIDEVIIHRKGSLIEANIPPPAIDLCLANLIERSLNQLKKLNIQDRVDRMFESPPGDELDPLEGMDFEANEAGNVEVSIKLPGQEAETFTLNNAKIDTF